MSDRATTEEFRLRSVAIAAFAPATLFGLAQGAMLPVIVASSLDRGASTAMAAFIVALLGIGSLVTNIPSGILATRIGERRAMLVAAAVTIAGLLLCIVNLGSGAWSLALYFTFGNLDWLGGHTGLSGIPPLSLAGFALTSERGDVPRDRSGDPEQPSAQPHYD